MKFIDFYMENNSNNSQVFLKRGISSDNEMVLNQGNCPLEGTVGVLRKTVNTHLTSLKGGVRSNNDAVLFRSLSSRGVPMFGKIRCV